MRIERCSFGNLDRQKTGQPLVRLTSDVSAVKPLTQVSLRIGTRAPLLMLGSLVLMITTSRRLALALAPLLVVTASLIQLPDGYQTVLSERGGNLSQGQRQVLAIARPLLAQPSIRILDEATSSVDTRTEARIQASPPRLMKSRTSLVIAHRLSAIRDADLVLVIDGGRLVESGTHQELLDRRGFYHHLYTSQFKGHAL